MKAIPVRFFVQQLQHAMLPAVAVSVAAAAAAAAPATTPHEGVKPDVVMTKPPWGR